MSIDKFSAVLYNLVMFSPKVYTPEQAAEMLQLSKSTIYDLISKGEIIAKRIGRVYRIPASSLSFIFTGLDQDLYEAQEKDLKALDKVEKEIAKVRTEL